MLQIEIAGEPILLLPGKAIFRPSDKTLIASDLHWGKAAHFRKNGIAIPMSTQHADEIRLAGLIEKLGAERLIIAGDLFHSADNNEVNNFAHWRNAHPNLHIDLVLGNHDILPAEKYLGYNIELHQQVMDVGTFLISHDEIEEADKFYIHGHIHPCFTAAGKGRTKVRLPCFCMDSQRLVLPSFGSFTGGHNISAAQYRHIYVIANEDVIQWQ